MYLNSIIDNKIGNKGFISLCENLKYISNLEKINSECI